MTFDAPAEANAVAIESPIPVAPAVTRTIFPATESCGSDGEMAAYGIRW